MPIGLFENELTVQVWQPVTVRGYTFGVADNVTLDQTKVKKTPAVGGDFAFLFADHQAEQTGSRWIRSGTGCRRPYCVKARRCRLRG